MATTEKETRALKKELAKIEGRIKSIIGEKDSYIRPEAVNDMNKDTVSALLDKRRQCLNMLMRCTPHERETLKKVSSQLLALSNELFYKAAKAYRQLLKTPADDDFVDDRYIDGSLSCNCDDIKSVEGEEYYGSDFSYMMQAISIWHYKYGINEMVHVGKSIRKEDTADMGDKELDFFNDSDNTGIDWSYDLCLMKPELKGIEICQAVYDLCFCKSYSVLDVLHLNNFWCEVKVCYQHIADQDGRHKWPGT
jgi:hypothetical protein